MPRLVLPALLVALSLGCGPAQSQSGSADRAETIVANLRHEFPQLAGADVRVDSLAPSGIDGLDRGVLTLNGDAQEFYVTPDGRRLLLLAVPPIDASRTAEQLAEARTTAQIAAQAAARDRAAALREATAGLPSRGPANAPVTIVEFSDFQCPYCKLAAATVSEILRRYPNDVRLVYAHFPLDNHAWAMPAAIASTCAAEQSDAAFWALHDGYFADQRGFTADNVMTRSRAALDGAGLDAEAWTACTSRAASRDAVRQQMALGETHGVSGTPGFFVNGQFVNGNQPIETFVAAVEAAKAGS